MKPLKAIVLKCPPLQIPTLASALASFKDEPAQPTLVRWRCMVQDTGVRLARLKRYSSSS
jgi:hypothetical protein